MVLNELRWVPIYMVPMIAIIKFFLHCPKKIISSFFLRFIVVSVIVADFPAVICHISNIDICHETYKYK